MTDHRYIPLEVQMLLDVHIKGSAFPSIPELVPSPPSHPHAAAYQRLLSEGMVISSGVYNGVKLTAKGEAWLEAVLTLPLPVESWRIPDRAVAVTVELDERELERKIRDIASGVVAAGLDPRRNR